VAQLLDHLIPFSILFIVWIGVYFIVGLYERQTLATMERTPAAIVQAQVSNVIIAALFFFFAPFFGVAPKTTLLIYLMVSVGMILLWRLLIAPHLYPRHRISALLIGEGTEIEAILHEIENNPRHGLVVEKRILPSEGSIMESVSKAVEGGGPSIIIIDSQHPKVEPHLRELYSLMFKNVRLIEAEHLYEEFFGRVPLSLINEQWFLRSDVRGERLAYEAVKYAMDLAVVVVGGVIAIPFCFAAAVALKATTPGPLFISQERIGRNGRTFRLVKFRSWLFDDQGDEELHKTNRITPVGKFLRRTRIDELPQLWNMLRGELSLIGPRPEIPKLVVTYEKEVPFYRARHFVKPGLSGWAQINDYDVPRGVVDVGKTSRKLTYDLYYLKHRSIVLDLHIALKTVRALLSRSGT